MFRANTAPCPGLPATRAWALFVFVLSLFCIGSASNGTIQISAFPPISVADGRSIVTITAEVRDGSGSFVPDDTQVVFETNLGMFRENIIKTQNGFARAILVSSSLPGTAKIRASVFRYSANATLEIDFVADRSLLSSAKEYIEVVGAQGLLYSPQERTIEAAAPNRGVKLRYRDIVIEADDLQLVVPAYEVRCRRARMTWGKQTRDFGELFLRLNQRKGLGSTQIEVDSWHVVALPRLFGFKTEKRARIAYVDILPKDVTAHVGIVDRSRFKFKDLTDSISTVEAKKAIAYPTREIQFHRANVRVSGTSVIRVPLFQLSAYSTQPLITEQFFNLSNNQLAIDYPYYLSLKPGETSLLRFRYGNRYASGTGATGGMYLDYEWRWNKGDQFDGGLTVSGLARDDWGIGIRQYWQPNDRLNLSAQFDMPAHRSLFGNASASYALDGYHFDVTALRSQSVNGNWFQSQQYSMVFEKNPTKLGFLPAQFFIGLTAQQDSFEAGDTSSFQRRYGVRARLTSDSLKLSKSTTLLASYSFSRYTGQDIATPVSHIASLTASTSTGMGGYLQTTYDYVDDGFSSAMLGRHRISTEAFFGGNGNLTARASLGRSLDVDRVNANLNLSYKMNQRLRLSFGYWLDRYDGESFMDQTIMLGYMVGFKEIGISYSHRTKRLGLDILGATLN